MTSHHADSDLSYMAWAKLRSSAPFNLALSGVMDCPLAELPVRLEELEINSPDRYGFKPLVERLARKSGAPNECIVPSLGTSMANFLAFAALIERGDEVLIERPTYQPLLRMADWLGATIRRFERPAEKHFDLDLEKLAAEIRPTTKLIVLTNLHNPSSAFISEEEMRRVGELAARVGARVFVDEVYLETLFHDPPRSAFLLGENFIVTRSLTKAYGLSGLRCGWIVASPEIARRLWELVDMTYGIPAHIPDQLSVIALDNLPRITQRAQALVEPNRVRLNAFIDAHREYLEVRPSRFGNTVAPRLHRGNTDDFCQLLRSEFETSVVPGRFFEAPEHFRLGLSGAPDSFTQGLARISEALARFHA